MRSSRVRRGKSEEGRSSVHTRLTSRSGEPLLLVDGVLACLLIGAGAFLARATISPDGVAYLENAELFAHGRFGHAIQGYWSPGFSILLTPFVWIAGDDRPLVLLFGHVLQGLLGLTAILLVLSIVKRRIPAFAQRLVFWGAAWLILRWLSQQLLTPDLLLCVLLLWFLRALPTRSRADEAIVGAIAAAAFLVKTSTWPLLVISAAVVAARHLMTGEPRKIPWVSLGTCGLVCGLFVATLSARAGHLTMGGVGPLNARWYLGDISRRTPDTDLGPHAQKTSLRLPDGSSISFHDMRASDRTYLPWSDPETWATGVPAVSRPAFSGAWARATWAANGEYVMRWFCPVLIILFLAIWTCLPHAATRTEWFGWLLEPACLTGALGVGVFLAVHVELRLLAPMALLLLLGPWFSDRFVAHRPLPRFVVPIAICAVVGSVTLSVRPHLGTFTRSPDRVSAFDRYVAEHKVRNRNEGVIVLGSATDWMGALWRNHLRVAVQIGPEGYAAVNAMEKSERLRWLRSQFGGDVFGVAEMVKGAQDSTATTDWRFSAF